MWRIDKPNSGRSHKRGVYALNKHKWHLDFVRLARLNQVYAKLEEEKTEVKQGEEVAR